MREPEYMSRQRNEVSHIWKTERFGYGALADILCSRNHLADTSRDGSGLYCFRHGFATLL